MAGTYLAAIAATLVVATTAQAELPAPRLASYGPPSATGRVTLPDNSEIVLAVQDPVSSKRFRRGARFQLSVVRNVMVGDTVVIPAGARADAEISWRTPRSSLGKSGKLEFNLVSIELADRSVPVSGHYRIEGKGETVGVIAALLFAGWPGLFVTGHSARITPGTEFRAYTRDAITLALPPRAIQQSVRARPVRSPHVTPTLVVQNYEGRSNGRDDAIEIPM